jgi:aspartate aminotransferase-like enzyme
VMEGAVANLTSPGDRVLVLTAGKFGERWRDLAKAYGCAVELVSVPYGETFSLEEIGRKLAPDVRAVYVQATESSTGVRHDIKSIAKLVRGSGESTLLVVDAITGLGTTHFDVDGWGIDVIIGGSQKAMMIPPGLAYCAVSDRAWKRMEETKSPRYYFDFRRERKAAAMGESAYTPATSLFAALGAALDFVREMGNGNLVAGRNALIDSAELAAEMARSGAKALGLKLFAASAPAAALTAISAPGGIDSSAIVREFRQSFGAVVANGQGEMKGMLFRIAHLGYYDYLDTIGILAALEHVLACVSGRDVEYGSAVRAAQQVYAESVRGDTRVTAGASR